MKRGVKIFLGVVVVLVLLVLTSLAYVGYMPALAKVLGWDKPKDLGISYTDQDKEQARSKSGVVYEELPASTPDSAGIQFSGVKVVNTSWSSAEMTALLNNRPWKYWPIKDVQLRINEDNTVEMSGVFNSDKLRGYGAAIGVPEAVLSRLNLLPAEAPFYLKGSSSLSENHVSSFDITSAEMGRVSIPTSVLLSLNSSLTDRAYAQQDLTSELSQYSGKKAAIVDFINGKLSWISGFYAKKANFSGGKLNFDGTLPQKELSTR